MHCWKCLRIKKRKEVTTRESIAVLKQTHTKTQVCKKKEQENCDSCERKFDEDAGFWI